MVDRLVLHVGTMKSGTSFLQDLLFFDKDRLAGLGVHVAGRTWNDQVRASVEALRPGKKRDRSGWDRMAADLRATEGTGVISMEYLGPARAEVARTIVEEVGADRTTVVVTARDLNRTLTSMWQETVQNGRPWTWADYYAAARDHRPGTGRGTSDRKTPGGTFWRQQHLARMVGTWADAVGRDQVVVVTLPQPGAPRDTLTRRFAEAADLPLDPEADVPRSNESLGLASVLVLREVNEVLSAQGLDFPLGHRLRKKVLAKTALPALVKDEPRLGCEVQPWVIEQTDQTVQVLRDADTRVVGDWADLDPVEVPGVAPDDVEAEQVARAAVLGLAAALEDDLAHRPKRT